MAATNNNSGVRSSGLPVLCIWHADVSNSWREWYEFELAIQFKELEMGAVEVEGEMMSKLTPQMKLLLLFKCISAEGRSTLSSAGITVKSVGITYYSAIERLERYYSRCESLYVRTQKFVTVRQCAGEDYSSYLLRVEKLSRSLESFNSENAAANDALQAAKK